MKLPLIIVLVTTFSNIIDGEEYFQLVNTLHEDWCIGVVPPTEQGAGVSLQNCIHPRPHNQGWVLTGSYFRSEADQSICLDVPDARSAQISRLKKCDETTLGWTYDESQGGEIRIEGYSNLCLTNRGTSADAGDPILLLECNTGNEARYKWGKVYGESEPSFENTSANDEYHQIMPEAVKAYMNGSTSGSVSTISLESTNANEESHQIISKGVGTYSNDSPSASENNVARAESYESIPVGVKAYTDGSAGNPEDDATNKDSQQSIPGGAETPVTGDSGKNITSEEAEAYDVESTGNQYPSEKAFLSAFISSSEATYVGATTALLSIAFTTFWTFIVIA